MLYSVKMGDSVYKWLFVFADLFGIFCFTFNSNRLKVSKTLVLVNVLKIFLAPCMMFLLLFSNEAQSHFYGYDTQSDAGYSTFAMIMAGIVAVQEQCMGIFVMVIHLHKRQPILNFLNRVLQLRMQEKFRNILKSRLKLLLCYSILICGIVSGITYAALFTLKFESFAIFLILMAPYSAEFALIVVVKSFEILFATLLEEFRNRLEDCGCSSVESLMKRYQVIINLNKEFHLVFGTVVTITTCGWAATAVAQVSKDFRLYYVYLITNHPFKAFDTVQSLWKLIDIHYLFMAVVCLPPVFIYLFCYLLSSGDRFDKETEKILMTPFNKQLKPFKVSTLIRNALIIGFIKFIKFQTEALLLQVIQNPIEFKIFNTVKLDYKLLYTILSAICSYFIILMQYEMGV